MNLKLKHKILILYAVAGLLILAMVSSLVSSNLGETKFSTIYDNFQNQLAHIDFALLGFIKGVEKDLKAIALDNFVRSKNDEDFTNFTEADPATFQYDIGDLEQKISDIFNRYRTIHEYVNSV